MGTCNMELSAKSVEGPSLPFEGINDIHCGDCLPLGMLGIRHSVPDDILQEDLQNAPGFFVDQTRDSLHTTSPSKPSDGRFCDTLNVIPQDFTVPLRSPLAKTLSSFAASTHS